MNLRKSITYTSAIIAYRVKSMKIYYWLIVKFIIFILIHRKCHFIAFIRDLTLSNGISLFVSILNQLIYHFPGDDDRYSDLILECYKFVEKNRVAGIQGMIAIGAFDIGMEHLILRLADVFDVSVWLNELRLKFVRFLEIDNCDNVKRVIRPLLRRAASTSSEAAIHVLDVANIHQDVSDLLFFNNFFFSILYLLYW